MIFVNKIRNGKLVVMGIYYPRITGNGYFNTCSGESSTNILGVSKFWLNYSFSPFFFL